MNQFLPKAVIFDLGSTLIEYESMPWSELSRLCAARVREYLSKKGIDVPGNDEFFDTFEGIKDEFRKDAAESLVEWTVPQAAEKLLQRLGISETDGLIDGLFDAYYQPVGDKIYAYEDALDTLEKLKKKVKVIGLVSNTIFPEYAHRKELKRFKIEPYLNFAIFSSTFGLRKPHPDIFYKAANCAGYAPAECVYVGDRFVEDFQGPSAIGMGAILKLLPSREYPPDMPGDMPTITCLTDLGKYLDI